MASRRVLDIQEAVDVATEMFWRRGYDGTSVSDLVDAFNVAPPSFYHAFESKEGLFLRVLDHYRTTRLQVLDEALGLPTAREVALATLTGFARLYTEPGCPPGCLSVNCALAGGAPDGFLEQQLTKMRKARRLKLRKRFKQAQEAGDLRPDVDPDALARFLMTVGWGMASDARSGASRADLLKTVNVAMQVWLG